LIIVEYRHSFFSRNYFLQINDNLSTESKSPKRSKEPKKLLSGSRRSSLPRHDDGKKDEDIVVKGVNNTEVKAVVEVSTSEDKNSSTSDVASDTQKPSKLSDAPGGSKRHWGRTPVSFFFLCLYYLSLKGSRHLVNVWCFMCSGEEKLVNGIY